jgi:hypothetical protein
MARTVPAYAALVRLRRITAVKCSARFARPHLTGVSCIHSMRPFIVDENQVNTFRREGKYPIAAGKFPDPPILGSLDAKCHSDSFMNI